MGDPGVILIISAVAIVVGIYVLRYILQKLFNKGTDAIGNARRKNRNEKNGAEVVRLADLYPEIAAMHRANGAEEVPISASAASVPRIPEEPKDSDRRTGLKATAIFITVMGILANLPFLFEVLLRLIRHARSFDSNNTVVAYSSYVYDIGVLRGILVLSLLSVAAYLILLFTKRINFTFFYPALTFILSILFYLVLNRYAAFYGGDRFAPDRTRNVPSNIQSAQNWATGVVFAVLVLGIFMMIYFIKRKQWSLWGALLFGIIAVFCSVCAFGQISGWTDEQIILSCNYGGYPLLAVLYSFAYKEENLL